MIRDETERHQTRLAWVLLANLIVANGLAFAAPFLSFLTAPDPSDGISFSWHNRLWMLFARAISLPIAAYAALLFFRLVASGLKSTRSAFAYLLPVLLALAVRLPNLYLWAWLLRTYDDVVQGYIHVQEAMPWLVAVNSIPRFLGDLAIAVAMLAISLRYRSQRAWLPGLAALLLMADQGLNYLLANLTAAGSPPDVPPVLLGPVVVLLMLGSSGALLCSVAFSGARGTVTSNRE